MFGVDQTTEKSHLLIAQQQGENEREEEMTEWHTDRMRGGKKLTSWWWNVRNDGPVVKGPAAASVDGLDHRHQFLFWCCCSSCCSCCSFSTGRRCHLALLQPLSWFTSLPPSPPPIPLLRIHWTFLSISIGFRLGLTSIWLCIRLEPIGIPFGWLLHPFGFRLTLASIPSRIGSTSFRLFSVWFRIGFQLDFGLGFRSLDRIPLIGIVPVLILNSILGSRLELIWSWIRCQINRDRLNLGLDSVDWGWSFSGFGFFKFNWIRIKIGMYLILDWDWSFCGFGFFQFWLN